MSRERKSRSSKKKNQELKRQQEEVKVDNTKYDYKSIELKSPNQVTYYNSIMKNHITFCTGFAGAGKSYIAIAAAIDLIKRYPHLYTKVVVVRPYIMTSSERIGAIPGSLSEKILPFAMAIKDNLSLLMCDKAVEQFLERIEFCVLSTIRGRSFNNAIILAEESQNIPIKSGCFKTLMTRIGTPGKLIISGDVTQSDIPIEECALTDAINRFKGMDGVGICEMSDYSDIQRNPLIAEILKRYVE